ncbi:hypothetical protein V6C53_02975 [Desulfocurvibacter africanus]|uniref:sulfate respiration complex protein HmcE n=1 Tax=Desulfocurvibacter africanus TaxID=873 RepID=UPI002FD888B8
MYELLTGPVLWLSFGVFFVGLALRTLLYIRGLDWKLDRVAYADHAGNGLRGALNSILSWVLPFGSRSWRERPGMVVLFFVFHVGLVITPLFLQAHAEIMKSRWGIEWLAMPNGLADALTIGVLVSGFFLALRRMAFPEIRILTSGYDYLLLAITVAPFLTGFMAGLHTAGYQYWLLAHVISGEIWLVAVPLTKLSHAVLFFLTRAQIGMDYGIKRGGMKKGLAW